MIRIPLALSYQDGGDVVDGARIRFASDPPVQRHHQKSDDQFIANPLPHKLPTAVVLHGAVGEQGLEGVEHAHLGIALDGQGGLAALIDAVRFFKGDLLVEVLVVLEAEGRVLVVGLIVGRLVIHVGLGRDVHDPLGL